ncbi:DMT family transporter [Pontibacillus halophilus]|nr:DMT family transporter [Pontibacillus halophilus]
MGIFLSIVAGILISVQNVFNSRISERAGSWATTTLVLAMGFGASIPVFYTMEDARLFDFADANLIFLFGGVFGVGIVFCLMMGIRLIGPAYAVSVVLISQLTTAFFTNTFGWFGFDSIPFTWNKAAGLILLIAGILVFKLSDAVPAEQSNESYEQRQANG